MNQTLTGWTAGKITDQLPSITTKHSRRTEQPTSQSYDRTSVGKPHPKIDEAVRSKQPIQVEMTKERSISHHNTISTKTVSNTEIYNFTNHSNLLNRYEDKQKESKESKEQKQSVTELKRLMEFLLCETKTMMKYESHRFYKRETHITEVQSHKELNQTQKSFFQEPLNIPKKTSIVASNKENLSLLDPSRKTVKIQLKPTLQKANTIRISGLINELNRVENLTIQANQTQKPQDLNNFIDEEMNFIANLKNKKRHLSDMERNLRRKLVMKQ